MTRRANGQPEIRDAQGIDARADPTRLDCGPVIRQSGNDDLTRVLIAIDQGDSGASEQLLPLVYNELRKLAAHKMSQENAGHSLDATALVHEAYLRLVDVDRVQLWNSRGHFFAAAAEAMRRILVEQARRKRCTKHGGGFRRRLLTDVAVPARDEDLIALDQALDQLAAEDPIAARVVTLHYFAGLGHERVAAAMGVSVYHVRQKWTYARAWLRTALEAAG